MTKKLYSFIVAMTRFWDLTLEKLGIKNIFEKLLIY